MRLSKYLIPTLKETPAEAEIKSHKYMIRAALLRKVGAGIYNYLPLCTRIIKKIENIIREEMDEAGALELILPILSPSELWQESGRWDVYGKELMRFTDRHNKEYALGPTHEEVITSLAKNEIKSYRQLPICLYQINTKFRDEIRPRFGVMRAREFIMKDGYSFHKNKTCLDEYYKVMYEVYTKIFKRCGLDFRAVLADSGAIGGDDTHEFMVLANSGESRVISCSNNSCGYAATDETAESVIFRPESKEIKELQIKDTPNQKTIEEVSSFFGVNTFNLVKTILYKAGEKVVAVLIRGDRSINEIKLTKILRNKIFDENLEIELADQETVISITGAEVGFAGPIGLPDDVTVIADNSVKGLHNFIVGANETDKHYTNVNYGRDFEIEKFYEFRLADKNDKCINCGNILDEYRGIEVGQIFKLGEKYSKSMNAVFTDESGKPKPFVMGCYGIGVTRIIAAAIEQNFDEKGIIWPLTIAPYSMIVIAVGKKNSEEFEFAEKVYNELKKRHVEVMFDDRQVSPGFKFKDAELIGIPIQIVIGKKTFQENKAEISLRKTGKKITVKKNELLEKVIELYEKELYDILD